MCARGLASFSPQAPGILIIPFSDVTGLGWGEVAVLQGEPEDRGLQTGGREVKEQRKGARGPSEGLWWRLSSEAAAAYYS